MLIFAVLSDFTILYATFSKIWYLYFLYYRPIPDPLAMKIQYYATLQGKWSMSDYPPW